MGIERLVNPVITTNAQGPSITGFGTPCVLAYHTHYDDRAREYTGTAGMVTDGFSAGEPATVAVGKIFSQTPRPKSVIVGRSANDQKQKITLTPVAKNETVYTFTIEGQDATFTSGASATIAAIVTGLKAAIDALTLSATVVVTDNTTDLDIEGSAIADRFIWHVNDHNLFKVEDVTPDLGGDNGIAKDIIDLKLENDAWYTIHPCNTGKAVLLAAAAKVEEYYKMMIVASPDTEIYDSTVSDDVLSTLQTSDYANTAVVYHHRAGSEFAGAIWAATRLPKLPGEATWMYASASGLAATVLTDNQRTAIRNKDGNYYCADKGLSFFRDGKTTAGAFIDLNRTSDWVVARMQEALLNVLYNADKVPYTDAGVQILVGAARGVIIEGQNNDALATDPEPTFAYAKVADVPVAQRQARNYPSIEIVANFAGAIHTVDPLNILLQV